MINIIQPSLTPLLLLPHLIFIHLVCELLTRLSLSFFKFQSTYSKNRTKEERPSLFGV